MSDAPAIARTPAPYYAVIFTSQRATGDHGYGAAAERMAQLGSHHPGCDVARQAGTALSAL